MSRHLRHRVRYHEADAQGFMFNSRFLELADVAMTEFFRSAGWPYDQLVKAGADPSVVSAQLTFSAPARFDDWLDLEVQCTRVGTSSFQLRTRVTRGGTLIADLDLVYVNVDTSVQESRALPGAIALALRASMNTIPTSTTKGPS
jgi:acyl-CoA thioester hydrolase